MNSPLCFVLGTRPEIIKLSSLIRLCADTKTPFFIIHTGQHYNSLLDKIFFTELSLPHPEYNLDLGKQSLIYPEKLGHMTERIEAVLRERSAAAVIVQGDTTSALAGALAAKRAGVKVAHLEAGLRSRDYSMTEEWNRIMIDRVADWYFAPTSEWKDTLVAEGVSAASVFVVGNSVVDAARAYSLAGRERGAELLKSLGVSSQGYLLATVHRAENTDDPERLRSIFDGIAAAGAAHGLAVILPLHPRTKMMSEKFGIAIPPSITVIEPKGYIDFLQLQSHARIIVTDSGGVQEEASILRIPCVTVRENTERPETVQAGVNIIGGVRKDGIMLAVAQMLERTIPDIHLYGDGTTAAQVLGVLNRAD